MLVNCGKTSGGPAHRSAGRPTLVHRIFLGHSSRSLLGLLGRRQRRRFLGLDDLGQLLVALHAVLLAAARHGLADLLPPLGGLAVESLQGLWRNV